jgi:hypothetical protein
MMTDWKKWNYIITTCSEARNLVFKMSDNENISMREINNNSILNGRQVHQNSEQRFTITTESELTWPLFHCNYFIKQLPNGFPCRIAWSMHLGFFSTCGKRKKLSPGGSSFFTLSESLETSHVQGSRNPATKTIRYSFMTVP